MQPTPPSAPNPSAAPPPRSSVGPGLIVGLLVLFAFVYLMDHASKGEAAVFGGVDRHISERISMAHNAPRFSEDAKSTCVTPKSRAARRF